MSRKLWLLTPVTVLLVVSATPTAQASAAPNAMCHSGDILTGTYQNVIVAKNNYCLLEGATVLGNVIADHAVQLGMDSSTVGGGVRVNDNSNTGFICGSTIGGTVEITNNAGNTGPPPTWVIGDESFCFPPFDTVPGNYIGGSLIFNHNASGSQISNNDVEGNLLCVNNTPSPGGSNNAVDNNANGQCASLAAGADDSASPPDSD